MRRGHQQALAFASRIAAHKLSPDCGDHDARPSGDQSQHRVPQHRPVILHRADAVLRDPGIRPTTTALARASTAHHGRLSNHHDFGQLRYCSCVPSVRPPRLRPVLRLLITAAHPTTTAPACAAAHCGPLQDHHGFGRLIEGAPGCGADTRPRPARGPAALRP